MGSTETKTYSHICQKGSLKPLRCLLNPWKLHLFYSFSRLCPFCCPHFHVNSQEVSIKPWEFGEMGLAAERFLTLLSLFWTTLMYLVVLFQTAEACWTGRAPWQAARRTSSKCLLSPEPFCQFAHEVCQVCPVVATRCTNSRFLLTSLITHRVTRTPHSHMAMKKCNHTPPC